MAMPWLLASMLNWFQLLSVPIFVLLLIINRAMGSKLFEPRSGDEYNAVTDQGLGEPGEYWLGLTRDNSQGQEE